MIRARKGKLTRGVQRRCSVRREAEAEFMVSENTQTTVSLR